MSHNLYQQANGNYAMFSAIGQRGVPWHKLGQQVIEAQSWKDAREVGSSMATLTKERNIELILDLSDDLPMLRFDRDKIVQVLTNLIDNAFKFTEKGSITIASAPAGEDVLVSVSDTGVGIKKEDFSKLFQQFEQLEKGGTRKAGGTGLGLAISKQIVEKHGGKIWIESHPGTGTTFYFTLPTKC